MNASTVRPTARPQQQRRWVEFSSALGQGVGGGWGKKRHKLNVHSPIEACPQVGGAKKNALNCATRKLSQMEV